MTLALIFLPLAAAVAAMLIRPDRPRRALLVGTAAVHAALAAGCCLAPPAYAPEAWVGFDAAGRLFLGIASFLFLAVSVYAAHVLGQEAHGRQTEEDTGSAFVNAPEAVYVACLLVFLSMMTLVAASRHLGLLWVAVEATTLATAPLIYFHRQPRSLEATWKYLLVCSVGIALALLGNFLLVIASAGPGGTDGSLQVAELVARGGRMHGPWLKAAFVFLLVGYGTKMGLVPMHTWLPDAHSEAPSPVSALLSGALLNCAFLGILRAHAICAAAGLGDFSGQLLVGFGLLSMGVAAAFLVHQPDYKRMLAYSSVENMGLLALGAGLGGAATYGALLHAVNHSAVKAALFMVAGNFLFAYRTKAIARIGGALHRIPASGALWLAGLFAIAGSPPFGTFASEFTMFRAAFAQGRAWVAAVALVALTIAFVGMSRAFLGMSLGRAPEGEAPVRERAAAFAPALVLLAVSLVLGLWIPAGLDEMLVHASRLLGGGAP
ncbi:MAG: proton-conducting transporter membrane subunit [Kiritimatiellia bacterium]